ncbi:TlpA disulfide reductase family protein [Chitinophaga sp. Cy-1792]|uniref:TlpA disulfide reductase family protein n=1 Tax=Chitinophaga sp. Cy-1792 TaxID=2608339 RepID=UPI001420B590|nr:TlpA disulfide reductase family protein [Chitinophaga sp. Cy-1792]NIG57167.1 AhpC/TSA family protein [Chitinophaga sp. Cy-1792]
MKKIIVGAVMLMPALLFAQEKKAVTGKPYTIQGTVSNLNTPAKVFLRMRKAGEYQMDSTVTKDGKFTFTGSLEEPTLVSLMLLNPKDAGKSVSMRKDMLAVYLDKGTTVITTADSISKATVTGSPANDDYLKLNEQLKSINEQGQSLQLQYRALAQAKDKEGIKALETKFDSLEAEQKKIEKGFFTANSGSPIALYVLNQVGGYDLDANEVEPMFKKLSKEARNSPSGKEFSKRLNAAKNTAVGRPAMDFKQADSTGAIVSLSSFRGKYVLVDFWASWCGPCRAENPNVVKAYEKFKPKGFEILGVSLDDKKEKWLAAVAADHLTWTHVSELTGWKNTAADLYGVRAIPQNFLIDPKGKIVGRNLRGEDLEKKLEEVLP